MIALKTTALGIIIAASAATAIVASSPSAPTALVLPAPPDAAPRRAAAPSGPTCNAMALGTFATEKLHVTGTGDPSATFDGVIRETSTGVFDVGETQEIATYMAGPQYLRWVANPTEQVAQLMFIRATGSGHTGGATGELIGYNTQISSGIDTTTQSVNVMGVQSQVISTKDAGSNTLTNIAVNGNASGGDVNYSFLGTAGNLRNAGDIRTDSGDFYGGDQSTLRLGPAITGTDSWIQGPKLPTTRVQLYINATNTITGTPHTADESLGVASVNQETFDTTSNPGGVTARGFEGTIQATRVAGAGLLTNMAFVANATGGDVNYSWYSPNGKMLQTGEAFFGSNILGDTDTRLQIGQTPGAGIDNWNTAPMATSSTRFVQLAATSTGNHTDNTDTLFVNSGLTYDLTAGVDKNSVAVNAQAVGTRAAGTGRVINIGIAANASGGQVNVAYRSDQGIMIQTGDAFFAGTVWPANINASGTLIVAGQTTLGAIAGGVISPTAISSTQNNWNPTGLSTAAFIRCANTAPSTLTGLAGGVTGRYMTISNISTDALTIPNQSASSTSANRFLMSTAAAATGVVLQQFQTATFIYNGNFWVLVATTP